MSVELVFEDNEKTPSSVLLKSSCYGQHIKFEYEDENSKIRKRSSLSGIFYERDCTCDLQYCCFKNRMTIHYKSENLYFLLPVFFTEDTKHTPLSKNKELPYRRITVAELKEERQCFYNELCEGLGVAKLSIHIMNWNV